jgi:hypothetical protein
MSVEHPGEIDPLKDLLGQGSNLTVGRKVLASSQNSSQQPRRIYTRDLGIQPSRPRAGVHEVVIPSVIVEGV